MSKAVQYQDISTKDNHAKITVACIKSKVNIFYQKI